MTNSRAFEIAVTKAGVTKKELANALNISEMSLFRKINNITEFKASEISSLQNLLNLSDLERDAIFFAQYSD